jgi:hypothetical protein
MNSYRLKAELQTFSEEIMMKGNPLPTLLALYFLASASLAQHSQHEFTPLSALWKRFPHADGRFKVLLPGEPDETASVILSPSNG